jgi:hypothetical protein
VVSVEAALVASSSALTESGRIDYRSRVEANGEPSEGTGSYQFSGDDRSHSVEAEDLAGGRIETRVVDGEMYFYLALEPLDPNPRWYHWVDDAPIGEEILQTRSDLDPATLFDQLAAAGPFDEVGRETLDGVPTRRLRATHPEALQEVEGIEIIGPGQATAIDVWVDDDSGLVRRVDVSARGGVDAVVTISTSLTFSDYGEPITIDAPADAQDVDTNTLR